MPNWRRLAASFIELSDVAYWHKADVEDLSWNVRFRG